MNVGWDGRGWVNDQRRDRTPQPPPVTHRKFVLQLHAGARVAGSGQLVDHIPRRWLDGGRLRGDDVAGTIDALAEGGALPGEVVEVEWNTMLSGHDCSGLGDVGHR